MVSDVCHLVVVLFLSFAFLVSLSSEADDTTVMKQLASMLSPTPSGWSNSSDYCTWEGIACDTSNRVSSIDLSNKSLSGMLPTDLNSLSNLISLSLQNNHLSGDLPTLANMKYLQNIYLDSNNFSSIPNGAFTGLISLRTLTVAANTKLSSWTIPIQLAHSPSLQCLRIRSSNLIGPIPDIFSSLPRLQNLDLSYNHLSGSLPHSLGGSSIEYLWLHNQTVGLSGPLHVLANMTSLTLVWLHSNKFTGPIPDLSNCTAISDLQLRDNLLTGVVPTSLTSLPNLAYISLQNNKLQGPLPVFGGNVNATLGATRNSFCKLIPGACDPQVTMLLEVAGAFGYPMKLADEWKGDNACNKWIFVTCNSFRKVTIFDFSSQHFQGTISPAFGNLTSLIEVHLNDNNLTGTIPESLRSLTQLRKLDVSNNNILPPLPHFASTVQLKISGNPRLFLNTPPSEETPTLGPEISKGRNSRRKSSIKIILPVLLGVLSALVSAVWIFVQRYKKRKHLKEQQKDEEQIENSLQLLPDSPVRFTYEVMKEATNNFDMQRRVGGGGFGSVFEGTLNNHTRVAVKRLDLLGQGKKEFLAEVRTIGSVQHVNLAKLVGFCAEKTHRLLVYEYMSNGSLDKWIFLNNSATSLEGLDWDIRKKIILHIAKGLAYLHEDCPRRIAHLDVKPQNVLLDGDFNAKLSDFGLAKLIDRDQSHVVTQMRGTRGCLAPEWLDRKITEKVDVYSYGVVVLEVVFGRKNFDYSLHEESDSRLIHMVRRKVEASQSSDLLDKCSEDMQQNVEEVEKTIKLAIWCLHTNPTRRPSMSTVVKILEGSMSMNFISDCDLLSSPMDENTEGDSETQTSDFVLSGPR